MILESRPATGLGALAAASTSDRISYESVDVRGEPTTMTGLVHLPHGQAPREGWPLVTYGHMTTGGGDVAAPSLAAADHPESRRMTQGDAFVAQLLARGCAVVQPDYEGIGGPGPHPYLIGTSLARAVIDMAQAARVQYPFAARWVSTGHSEGAVAALWAASTAHRDSKATGLELRGVCAFAPVTRMDVTIGASVRLPVVLPGFAVVSPLIGLMLSGAQTTDPVLSALLEADGLSDSARSVWSHLETRSLTEMCAPDSWGAIAPRDIFGAQGPRVRARLAASFRANEVARLIFRQGLPMRIEAALFDEVAPFWLTRNAMNAWESGGVRFQRRWWAASHSTLLRADRAPSEAAQWVAAQM